MQTFSRRPFAAAICSSLPFAFLAARLGSIGRILLTLTVTSIAAILLLLLRSRPMIRFCSVEPRLFVSLSAVMTLSLLLTSHALHDVYLTSFERLQSECDSVEAHSVTALVTEVRFEASYASTLDIELVSIDGESSRGSGILLVESSAGAALGDVIGFEGEFIPIDEAWEDYETDRAFMLASGIYFAVRSRHIEHIGVGRTPSTLLAALRQKLCAVLSLKLDREGSALACALLLGERSGLGIIRRDFLRSGVMHLLALSGLHLMLLCSMLERITETLGMKRGLRIASVCVFTLFYAALTGFTASLLRAAVMLLIMNVYTLTGRDRDQLTALFFAVWLIVLVDPAAICDVGLLMSFAATLGVLLMKAEAKKLGKRTGSKLLAYAVESVSISLGALLFLVPIQYFAFGSVSLWTLPATLLLVLPIELMLMLLIPYLTISLLGAGELAALFAIPIEMLSDFMLALTSEMSKTNALVSLEYPFTLAIMLGCIAVLLIMSAVGVKRRLMMLVPFTVASVIFLACAGIYTSADGARLYTLRDGDNDALILTDNGKCALIDMSDGSAALMRRSANRLRKVRAVEVDTLVLTHLHRKHGYSLFELIENCTVRRILLPEPMTESERTAFSDIAELADKYGVELLSYPRPEAVKLHFEDCTLTVYPHEYLDRSAHTIVSLKIELPDLTVAYLGSAYVECPRDTADVLRDADLILQGSHGPIARQVSPYIGLPEELVLIEADR